MTLLTLDSRKLTGEVEPGELKIRTSRTPIFDTATKTTFASPVTVPIGRDGRVEVELPPSHSDSTGAAFLYTLEAKLAGSTWLVRNVFLPDVEQIDITDLHNVAPAPGEATRVVRIPADGQDGQVLVWDGDGGFSWADQIPGPPGEVTTAALTAALAGKVTGQGMEVRVDTTVGTRVLLDHPGGTLMLHGDTGWRDITGLVLNGWVSSVLAIKRTGDDISLRGRLDGRAATADTILNLPVGWRIALGRSISHATPAGDLLIDATANTLRTTSRSQYFDFFMRWPATSTWPATTLGTPIAA